MTANLIAHYLVLLALAFLLEAPVYLLILRGSFPAGRLVLAAFIINLLTNPASNYVYLRWGVEVLVIEIAVVIAEAGLLVALVRCRPRRALWTSLAANLTSWALGVPIYPRVMEVIGQMAR